MVKYLNYNFMKVGIQTDLTLSKKKVRGFFLKCLSDCL